MTEVHRTVFSVEVFSDGLYVLPDTDDELRHIAADIFDGDCIGYVEEVSREIVPPEKVRDELIRIGNDGTYFDELEE